MTNPFRIRINHPRVNFSDKIKMNANENLGLKKWSDCIIINFHVKKKQKSQKFLAGKKFFRKHSDGNSTGVHIDIRRLSEVDFNNCYSLIKSMNRMSGEKIKELSMSKLQLIKLYVTKAGSLQAVKEYHIKIDVVQHTALYAFLISSFPSSLLQYF